MKWKIFNNVNNFEYFREHIGKKEAYKYNTKFQYWHVDCHACFQKILRQATRATVPSVLC